MESERAEVPAGTDATVDAPQDRDAESTSLVPWVPKIRSKRPSKTTVTIVAAVVLAATAILGIIVHYQLERSVTALSSEQARLQRTKSLLLNAQEQLTTLQHQSDSATHSLESETDQLAADQTQLARAQAKVFAQGVSISQLDTCLSGVEKSLNQISLGDQTEAAATLSGVSTNCQNAEPSGP